MLAKQKKKCLIVFLLKNYTLLLAIGICKKLEIYNELISPLDYKAQRKLSKRLDIQINS